VSAFAKEAREASPEPGPGRAPAVAGEPAALVEPAAFEAGRVEVGGPAISPGRPARSRL
jgi:hypothetical protein